MEASAKYAMPPYYPIPPHKQKREQSPHIKMQKLLPINYLSCAAYLTDQVVG